MTPPGSCKGVMESTTLMETTAPLRILLVEDDPALARLLQIFLKMKACQVVVATTGQEALDLWETEEFDLILMDVNLPGMSGIDVTGVIRDREMASGAHIPIIALTAHFRQEAASQGLAAGLDEYLPKPTNPETLYNAIQLTLQKLSRS